VLSLTFTHPVLNRLGLSKDVVVLQNQLSTLQRELEGERAGLSDRRALEKLNTELRALVSKERTDHQATKDRLAVVSALLNKTVQAKGLREAEQKQLAESLSAEQSAHSRTAADLSAARAALTKAAERYAALEASIRALSTNEPAIGRKASAKTRGEQRTARAAVVADSEPLTYERSSPQGCNAWPNGDSEGKNYSIRRLPQTDLVAGRPGEYFRIDLRNANDGSAFVFPAGRFTLGADRDLYREALVDLSNQIHKQLPDPSCYMLYLRGHADAGRLAMAHTSVDRAYRRIEFYPATAANQFGAETSVQILERNLENRHLPNLRAEFTKRQLDGLFPNDRVAILEGRVSREVNADARGVFLILYVAR
jgi:hypothetical protein